jgi:hypothetical protein
MVSQSITYIKGDKILENSPIKFIKEYHESDTKNIVRLYKLERNLLISSFSLLFCRVCEKMHLNYRVLESNIYADAAAVFSYSTKKQFSISRIRKKNMDYYELKRK